MASLKYITRIGVLSGLLALGACTKGFDDVNNDPTGSKTVPSTFLLSRSMLHVSGGEFEAWRGNLIYCSAMVQHLASVTTSLWVGDKYLYNDDYSGAVFNSFYPNAVKALETLIYQTSTNPQEVNINAMARIMKVLVLQRITDLYGQVPFTDAGRGALDVNFLPAYDKQDFIYDQFVAQLDAAAKSLDATKPTAGNADLSGYAGDVNKWKKLAYSLMLRTGMRLSKASPDKAKKYVQQALAGGVFTDRAETFFIRHAEGDYDNPNSHVLGTYPGARGETSKSNMNAKLSKTFVDILKSKGDPRLPIISELPKADSTPGGSTAPADQKGLPNGYDNSSDPRYGLISTGDANLAHYSQPRQIIIQPNSPNLMITYAEVQLMLAEAAARGWIGGDAAAYFKNGITGGIWQWTLYSPEITYDAAAAETYATAQTALLAAAPLEGKLEAINVQYYIATFLNDYETYANWRRSGYPKLTPVNYRGNETSGRIPRRLRYPRGEYDVNQQNINKANSEQGADNFMTPVWWDK